MDISNIIIPVASIGGLGVLFGAGLGFASIKFAVEEDPKIPLVREALPGANCGGCGYAGCDALASAIAEGKAAVNACPVGGAACAASISEIMGVVAEDREREVAYVMCGGECDKAKDSYEYYGLDDCVMAAQLPNGGAKSCTYGCLGLGSCKKVCPFDAIDMINGIAVINEEKCTACGNCVKKCPKALIELIPVAKQVRVKCHSKANGKITKQNCSVGCIACKLCEKACQYDAIHVADNISKVDYQKCVECGACVTKCPTKCIQGNTVAEPPKSEPPKAETKQTEDATM